jgi:hypothetical protein
MDSPIIGSRLFEFEFCYKRNYLNKAKHLKDKVKEVEL